MLTSGFDFFIEWESLTFLLTLIFDSNSLCVLGLVFILLVFLLVRPSGEQVLKKVRKFVFAKCILSQFHLDCQLIVLLEIESLLTYLKFFFSTVSLADVS
jgi:hypothetical protein